MGVISTLTCRRFCRNGNRQHRILFNLKIWRTKYVRLNYLDYLNTYHLLIHHALVVYPCLRGGGIGRVFFEEIRST